MNCKLKDIVEYSYENVPFYQELYQDDKEYNKLEDLPIVTKTDMLKKHRTLLSKAYYLNDSKLISEYTSGTTGTCMEISWDCGDMVRSLLPLWLYRKKYYGILPEDKFCYFYTHHSLKDENNFYEKGKNKIGFSKNNLSSCRLLAIYALMAEFEPKWLLLQPSIAILLAQTIFQNGLEEIPSLTYIELSGEMYTENQKKFIEVAFGCECKSQYGTHEVNSIAYECPCGNLHVLEKNVFVEVCKEGNNVPAGEMGNIIVTSLNNHAMPFIRYDTGDIGRLLDNTCPCGNSGSVIELLGCRKNDVVACDDESNVNAYEFVKIFQCINNYTDIEIQQYQIVQKGYREFLVQIASKAEKKKIISYFLDFISNDYLKRAEFIFDITTTVNATGQVKKHKFFTSLVNRNSKEE